MRLPRMTMRRWMVAVAAGALMLRLARLLSLSAAYRDKSHKYGVELLGATPIVLGPRERHQIVHLLPGRHEIALRVFAPGGPRIISLALRQVAIAIAVVAVLLGVTLALREGPLVADPPYVPRAKPHGKLRPPILIAGLDHRRWWSIQNAIACDAGTGTTSGTNHQR